MVQYLYYFLLGAYALILAGSLAYHLGRKAPGGDAAVGWAMGILYSGGLGLFVLMALLLKNFPGAGLAVLLVPPFLLAVPKLRHLWRTLYAWWPVAAECPPLRLNIENNIPVPAHVRLECWFPTGRRGTFTLYDIRDFYVAPSEKKEFQLDARQTRLLAHKSDHVRIVIFEQEIRQHEGHTYSIDIQPATRFFEVKPEAFRTGTYQIVVE